MKYLTTIIGKELNRALKILKVISNQDKEIILNQRDEIEYNLIKQNKKYYRKVFNTKAYQDKVYKELLKDDTSNRILRGNLR